MPDTRANLIKELFNDAIELDENKRAAFIDRSSDDESVRRELQNLIGAHERAAGFLSDPTIDGAERPGETIGRYRLHNLLGEGGFGRVYRAEQYEPVTRTVALKIIKLGMDSQQVIARFGAERQALAMMDHPGIASVFDAGATATGRPYFVMEFVDGVNITEYCDRHALSVAQRIDLFRQVCAAVQHAHTKGVIHRDLKPSNVLVSNGINGVSPRPTVIDFGIAKSISTRLTGTTVITDFKHFVGTPEYMSPEQADLNAIDIDTRSDIYSLGVMLYELLTGVTPFDSKRLRSSTFGELQRIIREEEPPKPSTRLSSLHTIADIATQRANDPKRLVSELENDLDWIALKALEKDRDQRYSSAAELADDLQRYLKHEPVVAGPPSTRYKLKMFVRRNRIGVIAGSLVMLAIMGGVAGTMVGMIRAGRAAQDARNALLRATSANEFMREVLTSVEPDVHGADVRLIDVLDNASRLASQRFAGQPDQEGAVRVMLGQVYLHLSQDEPAVDEFKRAVAFLTDAYGADDRRTLFAEVQHVRALLEITANREARNALEGLLPRVQQALGPNDDLAFETEVLMYGSDIRRGHHDAALSALRDLEKRATTVGASDAIQIEILNGMILAQYRTLDATGDPAVRDEIENLAREMRNRAERIGGHEATMVLRANCIVADMMWRRNDARGAADICTEILASSKDRLGQCHSVRVDAMEILAEATQQLGDSAAASDLLVQTIDCIRAVGKPVALLAAISDALPILDRGGRWAEGESLAREYATQLEAFGGGHGDMSFDADLYVARFVSLQGRLDEAASMFQSLHLEANDVVEPLVRARFHLFLGSNLTRQGQFAQAEEQLQDAAEVLPDIRSGTTRTNPDDVIDEFIALYDAWQKSDLASKYEAMRAMNTRAYP